MKSNQSIWNYYKYNIIDIFPTLDDIGDNLDDNLPECNTSDYDQVIEEVSSKINSQLKESAKIYQNLTPEEKCKWDKLQSELDESCKINFTTR